MRQAHRLTLLTILAAACLLVLSSSRALHSNGVPPRPVELMDTSEVVRREAAASRLRSVAAHKRTLPQQLSPAAGMTVDADETEPTETSPRFTDERPLDAVIEGVLEGQVVWLGFANSAVADIAVNWAAHVRKIGMIRSAVIAALDQMLFERLLSEGVPSFRLFSEDMAADVRSSRVGFRRLGVIKAELVLRVLSARRHVLVSDADVVWLRDPMDLLRQRSLADVMVSSDCLSISADETGCINCSSPSATGPWVGVNRCAHFPGNGDGHAAFNTGILYFSSTPAGIAVAAAWLVLLSRPSEQDIDDQLALNHIIWHSMRNTPSKAVERRGAVGLGMISCVTERVNMTVGGTPGWRDGWARLGDRSDSLARLMRFQGSRRLVGGSRPQSFVLAVLPTRSFCSGHLYWQQQRMRRGDCVAVHTTFTLSGTFGKIFRWREAHLWLLQPEHYSKAQRLLTFSPPKFIGPLPPPVGELLEKNDKFKAGWLAPDAIRLSPRLRAHLELVRRHRLALRDALAIAHTLNRTLVLPAFECLCDRADSPSLVLPNCIMRASELRLPFVCPMTHLFDLPRLMMINDRPDGVSIRERTYLTHPLLPDRFRRPHAHVAVVERAHEAHKLRAAGHVALVSGSSDAQVKQSLSALEESPVVHLERTEGVFGGWHRRNDWQAAHGVAHHIIIHKVMLCRGTLMHADPVPTIALPSNCSGPQNEFAWEEVEVCIQVQRERVNAQQPFEFNYTLDAATRSQKGFYALEKSHS